MNRLFANFPSEIRALFFIKIFTTFSYAVLYSSLILYMNQNLKLSSVEATGVVGVFISLNFLLHFAGAYAGGKLVSNRTLLVAGMCLELVGCLILNSSLYVGLGIFLSGSGLYATSINAIMIQQYQPEDDRRELASFWLYSAMNLGFFIGGTVSGYFHMYDQYTMMFYLAALVSIGSIVLILINWHSLQDKTTEYISLSWAIQRVRNNYSLLAIPLIAIMVILALYYHEKTSALIISCGAIVFCIALSMAYIQAKANEKGKIMAFSILVFSALAFWSLFFIGPMGLTLFIKYHVNNELWGWHIAPQWYHNINTVIIVFGGPILAGWFKRKREQGAEFSFPFLFSLGLLCIGLAYVLLPVGMALQPQGYLLPMLWVVLSYILLTLGELFLSPIGVAMVGKVAPQGKQGLLLGIWSMVSGIATMISKYLSQMMVIPQNTTEMGTAVYAQMFNRIGWGAIIISVVLFSLIPFVKSLINNEDDVGNSNSSAKYA